MVVYRTFIFRQTLSARKNHLLILNMFNVIKFYFIIVVNIMIRATLYIIDINIYCGLINIKNLIKIYAPETEPITENVGSVEELYKEQ